MTKKDDYPNIFKAAVEDDPAELKAALEAGQSLNDIEEDGVKMTPIQVACIKRSRDFLAEALTADFDPWIRDANQRLAIDHARCNQLPDEQKILLNKMYPPGCLSS